MSWNNDEISFLAQCEFQELSEVITTSVKETLRGSQEYCYIRYFGWIKF